MQSPFLLGTKGTVFQRLRRVPLFWIVVLTGMVSILVTDAVMQYRWTKQLSLAAEAGFRSTLQELMIGWHLDFYGELSAVCVALQVGPDSGARDNWNDYLHRYIDWRQAPSNHQSAGNIYSNPDLIKDVYIWETAGRSIPRLLRFNHGAAKIEASSIPEDLQPLLARLQIRSSNLSAGLHAWEFSDSSAETRLRGYDRVSAAPAQRSDLTTGWQFDRTIPAIVHPIVDSARRSGRPDAESVSNQDPINWIVVVLNLDYIQKKVLPDLAKRDFGTREGLEYKLSVIAAGKTPQVIYSSDIGFPGGNQDSVDSRMNIFGPPPGVVDVRSGQVTKNSKSIRHEDWRSFAAPGWFPVIQYSPNDSPWTLLAQHRAGPLEAMAGSVFWQNLLTGSIVLLLLTCGMFLIVFATRRAQKLAKLQLDFVAAVSHELLTPLAAIYCTGENFMDGLVRTEADSMAHGSIITSQARQLTDMVRQILLFASTQNGTIRYSLRPLQVLDILESVRKNVATLVEGNGFVVEQQIQAGLPNVMGDLPAVSQCVQNLILNAAKYSGKNRWIGISASVQEVKNHRQEIQISIQDQGTGISSSELPHIFDPFYRSPSAVDAQIHGTGLGLAVAKRIAQAMGGSLTVTSEVQQGSTFTLHLPVQWKADREIALAVPGSGEGIRNE